MDEITATAIEVTETAYDLERPDEEWLPNLLKAGLPMMDAALGVAGVRYVRTEGRIQISQVHVASGPRDFPARKQRMMADLTPDMQMALTRPGAVGSMSELTADVPGTVDVFTKHYDYAKDALGINALDPDGRGIVIVAPRPVFGPIPPRPKKRWEQIAAHFAAAHRLREALREAPEAETPLGAEAVIDPKHLRIAEAQGEAKDAAAIEKLRDAAKQMDRARGKLRHSDPEMAIEIWQGLVDGRWSLVDYFDSDGRRFVVARANAPELGDPRGLTEREHQVAMYTALGESGKLIGYRLGIAPSAVSTHLRSAMKKLGVKTQPQLVARVRGLGAPEAH
ncbi:MAG: helix-turn-helix transcriptional regulator [Myxococcota bacterium]|nr:helix-turn-helix transcriptional regulator [Myxococcota bacterium]